MWGLRSGGHGPSRGLNAPLALRRDYGPGARGSRRRGIPSVEPEILPVSLRGVVNGIVSARSIQRQLLRRQLEHVQCVARHDLLAKRVVHDDLNHPQLERDLLEEKVTGVSRRFVAILLDPDDRGFVVLFKFGVRLWASIPMILPAGTTTDCWCPSLIRVRAGSRTPEP